MNLPKADNDNIAPNTGPLSSGPTLLRLSGVMLATKHGQFNNLPEDGGQSVSAPRAARAGQRPLAGFRSVGVDWRP